MAHGFEVRDGSNKVTFSTDDISWNFCLSVIVTKNQTGGYHNLVAPANFSEFLVTRQMVNQAQGDEEAKCHDGYVTGSGRLRYDGHYQADKMCDTLFIVFGR